MKISIFRFIIVLIFCSLLQGINAQLDSTKIHKLEYFFDTDPGFGNGNLINISPAVKTISNLSFNPAINNLTRGLHTLFVRGLDSAYRWSTTDAAMFFKETSVATSAPTIVSAEYFFDTDPGFGNAIPTTVTAGQNVNFAIAPNIAALKTGLHQLFIRTKDANGNYSLSTPQLFYSERIINNPTPNIVAAEYFFDTDPGFGNAAPAAVTAGQNVSFAINPTINNLATGLHQLFIRTKDANGNYSLSTPQLFYNERIINNPTPNIVSAEYFFDTDPGFGSANPATVTAGQTVSFAINPTINNLKTGLHQLFIRTKDANGNYSLSTPQLFYSERIINNPTPNVIAAEYFFDTDPGFGNALPAAVTAGQSVSFAINPTINVLKAGLHNLFIRTKDASGNWSLSAPQTFYNEKLLAGPVPNVTAAEYFFDADPGFGNASPATVTANQNVSFAITGNIAPLSNGLHQLFVRAKDANGNWSLSTPQLFYKERAIGYGIPYIIAAEYFFDDDPGFGKAIKSTDFTAAQSLNLSINGDIDTLKTGLHQLFVRMKDTSGNWSLSTPQLFYKEKIINNLVPNVIAAEYFFDTDPGFGNATATTVSANQTVNFPLTGNIASLSTGLHQLFVRTKDANGNWSLSTPQLFYKERSINNPVPNIVAAEYYFDVDPGFGNAVPFAVSPASQSINQNFTSAINGLNRGLHKLFIRTKDANGIWSQTTPSLFYKETSFPVAPNKDLVVLEWFWNKDPGFGNASKITLPANNLGQISNLVFNIPTQPAFSNTKQNLFIRVLDDWSLTMVKQIDFSSVVLPVTWLEFSAKAQQQDVALTWSTAQETNSDYFDIEFSTDGINFSKIGSKPAAGNTSIRSNYNFLHTSPIVGINYYRLKQVDKDGKSTYSAIAAIMFTAGKGTIVAYPNPVKEKLNVVLPNMPNSKIQLQLVDMKGAIVLTVNTSTRRNELNVANFASGSYRLIIKNDKGETIFQQQVIKE